MGEANNNIDIEAAFTYRHSVSGYYKANIQAQPRQSRKQVTYTSYIFSFQRRLIVVVAAFFHVVLLRVDNVFRLPLLLIFFLNI